MNITIEKIKDINIKVDKLEKSKDVEKSNSSKDQLCMKMFDYFIF